MAARVPTSSEPRPALTRDRVLTAALALADEQGTEALSMRKLADRLGVEAMSLYHHVANKDEMMDALVDRVFSEVQIPTDRPWREAMRQRALSVREVLGRHRWAVGLMESRARPGLATLRHHDAVLGVLRRAGFSVAMAAHAFSVLDSYIYGFAMQELNLPFSNSDQLQAVAGTIFQHLPAQELPWFTELVVEHALKPGYAYAHEFEFGLDLILDGLARASANPTEEHPEGEG